MEFGAKNNKNILLIYEKFVLDQWNIFAKQPKDHWSIWINKKTLNNSGSLYLINPKDSLTSLLFLNIKYFLYLKILHDFIMMDRLFNYKFPVGRSLNYHRFYLNFINLDQLRYYLYMNQQYSAMFGLLLADRQKRDFKNIKNFYNFLKSYNLRTFFKRSIFKKSRYRKNLYKKSDIVSLEKLNSSKFINYYNDIASQKKSYTLSIRVIRNNIFFNVYDTFSGDSVYILNKGIYYSSQDIHKKNMFKKSKRYIYEVMGSTVLEALKKKKIIDNLEYIKINNIFNFNIKNVLLKFKKEKVDSIILIEPRAHNGCRPKKKRRL